MPLAVHNKLLPPDLADVQIKGSVGALLDLLIERRITSEDAKTVIYREAEDAFKHVLDDQTIIGYWQGEFWGKWMISAARVCRYLDDPELRAFIRQSARQLIGYQRSDGYIGTYRNSLNVFACDRAAAASVVGWPCNWNWNIWCRKYTLWGLIECAQLLGDPDILEAATRLADHLIRELGDNGIRLSETGTFNGLPSGSIIKPMTLLWQITGRQSYLDFAVAAAEDWDRPDGRCPNLIANSATGLPLHEWYPEPQTWAKAYELMSCLDGLLELYRATGTKKYFLAVKQIHQLLAEHELSILDSVGFNDIFAHAAPLINAVSEACDVIHWMRLNYELFALTGQIHYMDLFERAACNAFLASVYRDGRWGSRGVRSSGRHITAYQVGFRHNHCCVNNLPRGFMNMSQAAVMHSENELVISQYLEQSVRLTTSDGRPVQVEISGSYLQSGHAVVSVTIGDPAAAPDPARTTRLLLRIPTWSKQTTVRRSGSTAKPPAGAYYASEITDGTTVFDIDFDQTPHLQIFPHMPVDYGPDDFRSRRWTLDTSNSVSWIADADRVRQRMYTLQVGPLLLARSKRIGHTEAELFRSESLCTPTTRVQVRPHPLPDVRCGFAVTLETDGKSMEMLLCDYASAANEILDDPRFFNIYL